MTLVSFKNSLAAGELSPSLLGRVDLAKYASGASTCRNFVVDYRGGVFSRGGLAYVGTCKQSGADLPPRDIPFQFNIFQGYALEFGNQYMRIKSDGAYVTEPTVAVSSVSSAALFTTSTNHGYSVGDWIYDVGDTGFNGLTWIVHTVPTSREFTVTDLFGNVISSATASGPGGTVARIYTLPTPYLSADLFYLKYTQSADVMTLTCVNTQSGVEYSPYSLTRTSATNWTLTPDTFTATIQPPTNLVATAQSSAPLSTWYVYVVTAVDSVTGEESNPSAPIYIQNNDIALYEGSNVISWTAPSTGTPSSYNVYTSTPSYGLPIAAGNLFGFIGTSLGTSFTDTNYQADFTQTPPNHYDPFQRGQVTNVTMTAGGKYYDPINSTCTVTSSTGANFSGQPVVAVSYQTVGGILTPVSEIVGVAIQDNGFAYTSADVGNISFSCPGGVNSGSTAFGYITYSSNPSNSQDVFFNNAYIQFTLPNSANNPVFNQVAIGPNLAATLQNLAAFLNAYDEPLLSTNVQSAIYYSDATHIYVQYKTPGSVGNAYTLNAGTSGGTVSGSTLSGGGSSGTGASATLTIGPETGTYPGTCAYFQQRRAYGSSLNNPDTYWMSKPGLFMNMDSSIPLVANDAITGTPWAQQVNGIQFMVPMPGGLVVLTGRGAWQVNGGNNAALTPTSQVATPQAYNGCHDHLAPIPINYDILYVQAKGSIIRDLSYNFFVNIYTGTDLTILSNHLFENYQIQQWAWTEEPYKILWLVRNDGTLLSLTYLKEQEIYAWSRHDTNGLFQCVCAVTEFPGSQTNGPSGVDAAYFIVKRYVQGSWHYYAERMDNRQWLNVEESFCVDAGLAYPQTSPNATLSVSAAGPVGSTVTLTASASVFSAGNIGNVVRSGGGNITITGYTSGTSVTGKINSIVTSVVPNDPNFTPTPQLEGLWTISVPTSTVSGLNHLNGLEVAIVADGSVVSNQTVTNNAVTLPQPASNIVVGLPYTCQLQTMYMDHPGENSVQNRRKTISAVGLRVESSRGLQIGADQIDASTQQNNANVPWVNMIDIKDRQNSVALGAAVPLYTGDYYQAITSSWKLTGQVAIQQVYPLPATILGVTSYWSVGDGDK